MNVRRGSSAVEQRTENPCVGSSILPLGTPHLFWYPIDAVLTPGVALLVRDGGAGTAVHWVVNMSSVPTAGAPLTALAALVALLGVACADDVIPLDVIPPCTPVEGSVIDPCRPSGRPFHIDIPNFHADGLWKAEYAYAEGHLDPGYLEGVAHIVIRATTLPDTIRCRFGMSRAREGEWRGGDTRLRCFVDVRVNEYIVGNGPATLTILYLNAARFDYAPDGEQPLITDVEHAITQGGTIGYLRFRMAINEWVMFLRPPWDVAVEVWDIGNPWDVRQLFDGSIVAINPLFGGSPNWMIQSKADIPSFEEAKEPKLLEEFVSEIKAAHEERVREYDGRIGADEALPKLVQRPSDLREYFMAVGAYDHPDGPPAQPPPP